MTRSLKKGPNINERLVKKVLKMKPGEQTIIKVWQRSSTIVPEMIGFTFGVYNGKEHVPVFITEEMVGFKLGAFSPTTKFGKHGGRMQREIEAKAAEAETAKVEAVKTADAPAPKNGAVNNKK